MNYRGKGFGLLLHAATGGLAVFSLITNLLAGNYDVGWQANTIIFVCLSATHMMEVIGYENMIEVAREKANKMLEEAMEAQKKFNKKHSTKTEK
jgi:Tfp pilus assembly protein PilO